MADIEFVNRRLAESEGARAIGLLNSSNESKVEAWFTMQAVANLIGPESNTGRRGVSWVVVAGRGRYNLKALCVERMVDTSTGAPKIEDEALDPARLDKAEALLATKVEENGGWKLGKRPKGTSDALVEAVSATPEGSEWIGRTKTADKILLQMVRVADAYGREGINPQASLSAHVAFLDFDNRDELIQACQSGHQARAKAMSLGLRPYQTDPASKHEVSQSRVVTLALRTGVTRLEARVILRALMDGRSKTKLIRAINEADKVLGEPVRMGRPRKDMRDAA